MKKMKIITLVSIMLLASCGGKTNRVENKFTYYGYYDGMTLTPEEQKIVDNGVVHVSESYLLPTEEYSFPSYPFEGTTENEYLKKHQEEIIEFLEDKYYEQLNGQTEIEIREDRIFDFVVDEEAGEGNIIYRYDVKEVPNWPGFYNVVVVDMDMLETKIKDDKWDEDILSSWHDVGWYSVGNVQTILSNYYSIELVNYYSETVVEINEYLNSTGNYYDASSEEKAPYGFAGSHSDIVGAVSVSITPSQKVPVPLPEEYSGYDIYHYFNENQMTTEEVVNYIENSEDYTISFRIEPWISKEIYDDNHLVDFSKDYVATMQNFTSDNLDWIVEDKDAVKSIIANSGLDYGKVYYTLALGYMNAEANATGSGDIGWTSGNYFIPMRVYKDDEAYHIEDLYRVEVSDNASGFYWEGNK